jgi:hypothetical protein
MTQQPLMLEKKYADLEYIKFYPFFDECFTQLKAINFFFSKFLAITKLFSGETFPVPRQVRRVF